MDFHTREMALVTALEEFIVATNTHPRYDTANKAAKQIKLLINEGQYSSTTLANANAQFKKLEKGYATDVVKHKQICDQQKALKLKIAGVITAKAKGDHLAKC